jgi:hypothetical protein
MMQKHTKRVVIIKGSICAELFLNSGFEADHIHTSNVSAELCELDFLYGQKT